MNDVPDGRAPPTEARSPLRTFQNCAATAASCVNSAGSSRARPASVAAARASAAVRAAALGSRNSTSRPVAVSGSACQRAGTPGFPSTARSDARSVSSTAAAPSSTNGLTAAHAERMSGKIMNDVSRYWLSGTVSKTASAMKASVPSEPTIRRRKMPSGVAPSRNASMW
jgi:hypothetical protein